MIARLLRLIRFKRDLDRNLKTRRQARAIRAEAARRGQSTEWRTRAARCRELFS